MPLLLCPNDNSSMQTIQRSGVELDVCPTCRGVWLDRGELEKLMEAATAEGRAAAPQAAPPPQQYQQPYPPQPAPQPWGQQQPYRDDRRYKDDDYKYRKKKRDSIFDIFD